MRVDERRLRIGTEGDVSRAVMLAMNSAKSIGMSDAASSALATAVSELASNVVKYAVKGTLLLRPLRRGALPGIEMVISDHGPGIADIDQVMMDGFSTGGSLGLGLPGTKRLVDEFELSSEVGRGTRVRIVKWG